MNAQFELDGKAVEAAPGETIWQVARREGVEIRYLCLTLSRAIDRTAIAGGVCWKSRVSAFSRPPASARPRSA